MNKQGFNYDSLNSTGDTKVFPNGEVIIEVECDFCGPIKMYTSISDLSGLVERNSDPPPDTDTALLAAAKETVRHIDAQLSGLCSGKSIADVCATLQAAIVREEAGQ